MSPVGFFCGYDTFLGFLLQKLDTNNTRLPPKAGFGRIPMENPKWQITNDKRIPSSNDWNNKPLNIANILNLQIHIGRSTKLFCLRRKSKPVRYTPAC